MLERGLGREKAMQQRDAIDLGPVGEGLRQVRESDQQQENERDRRQQRVERQGAGEKRDIVFISGL